MNTYQSSRNIRTRNNARRYDPLGAVSFGVFIIIIAVMQLSNPTLTSEIVDYFKSFEIVGHQVPPTPSILYHVADFCLYFGIWLILLGALRVSFRIAVWRVPSNIAEGIFFIVFNYVIIGTLKTNKDVGILLPLLIIGLGIAIIAGAIGQSIIRQ